MLNMSFYNNTLKKNELLEFIKSTDKPIKYTYGYKYKNPVIYERPISKAAAVAIINNNSLLDAKENSDYLDLNAYSGSDMW